MPDPFAEVAHRQSGEAVLADDVPTRPHDVGLRCLTS
jgi:hypothetical protein